MGLLVNAVREISGSNSRGITPSLLEELETSIRGEGGTISVIKQANKLISQLLAKAWLQGDRNLFNREAVVKILMDNNLIDSANELELLIDDNPYEQWNWATSDPPPPLPPAKNYEGYLLFNEDPTGVRVYTPFPERPPEITDSQLTEWINQDPSNEPLVPNVVYIPSTC